MTARGASNFIRELQLRSDLTTHDVLHIELAVDHAGTGPEAAKRLRRRAVAAADARPGGGIIGAREEAHSANPAAEGLRGRVVVGGRHGGRCDRGDQDGHEARRAREAVAELHGLMVTRTNGMQADKKLREGRGVQNTEDQIEFLCFHAISIDLRG